MKALIVVVVLLALDGSTATIDVKKLKETAAPLLQTLTDTASTKLQTLTDTASTKLQTFKQKASAKLQELTDNASANLHEFVDSIDLNKLKELDFLNIGPKVHHKLAHKHFPPHLVKVKHHSEAFKRLKVKPNELALAFAGKYPWPVVTRQIVYIYD